MVIAETSVLQYLGIVVLILAVAGVGLGAWMGIVWVITGVFRGIGKSAVGEWLGEHFMVFLGLASLLGALVLGYFVVNGSPITFFLWLVIAILVIFGGMCLFYGLNLD